MDIHICNYPVFVRMGWYREERLRGQEIFVSLRLSLAASDLQHVEDELAQTVDYGKVIAVIQEVLQDREVKLIETGVLILCREIMRRFSRVLALRVEVEKPLVPDGIARGAKISVSHEMQRG